MKYGMIAVILIILLGGGFFVYQYNSKTEDMPENHVSDDGVMMKDDRTMTLKDLLIQNKQAECTFKREDDATVVSGVVYLDGERMRGTFTMSDPQFGNIDGSVIRDGRYAYAWGGPLGDVGTKITLDDEEKSDDFLDYDEGVDIDCKDWKVDESFFVPPADIVFEDISEVIDEINATTNDVKDAQCGACDSIPDATAKEQCRQALHC